jgi:hypothetical protein
MNKLLVQYINNKFVNNIKFSKHNFCDQLVIDTKDQLYKIYYSYKFTHAIFIKSLLTGEELQFIDEFSDTVHLYVYDEIKNILINCSSKKNINIPTLVNNNLFYSNNNIKENLIVSFLDKIEILPPLLNSYLYPNSKLPIKLFNNQNIIHPQNLGLLYENDKAVLLQNSRYYLALDEDYVAEAWACGCDVLTIEDLESLCPSRYKHKKSFQSYSNFLKVLLNAKK